MAKAANKPAEKSAFKKATDEAFHEVYSNVPSSVEATGKTGEEKRRMMVAIARSKARSSVKKAKNA